MKDKKHKRTKHAEPMRKRVIGALLLALVVTGALWCMGIVKPVSGLAAFGQMGTYDEILRPIKKGVVVAQTFSAPEEEFAALELTVRGNADAQPGVLLASLWDADTEKCLQSWKVDTKPFLFEVNQMMLHLDQPITDAEGRTFRLEVTSDATAENAYRLWKSLTRTYVGSLTLNGMHATGELFMRFYKADTTSVNVLYLFLLCLMGSSAVLILPGELRKFRERRKLLPVNGAQRDTRLRTAVIGELVLLVLTLVWIRLGQIDTLRIASLRTPVVEFWVLTFSAVWWTTVYWADMSKRPETIYLIAILSCGLVYLTSTPLAVPISWDEAIHFDRTVSLAHFITGKTYVANRWVCEGPVLLGDYFDATSVYRRQGVLQDMYVTGAKGDVCPDYLRLLSAICYAPGALFLLIGQLLPISFAKSYAFGELGNLLLYAVLTYFAVRKVRSGKMIVATSALVVVSVFQAAHYTYDSWLTAFFIYGFACFIAAMQEDRVLTTRDQVLMIGAFVLGNCAKACYFPIMAVLLWLPEDKFSDADHCIRFRSAVLSSMTALALTIVLGMKLPQTVVHLAVEFFVLYWPVLWVWRWMHKRRMSTRVLLILVFFVLLAAGGLFMLYRVVPRIMNVGDARGGDVNAPAQLLNILQHPLRCGRIMVEYLVTKLFYFGEEKSWLMNFNNIENLPKPMIWRFFPPALLALVAVTDKSELDRWERRGWVRWTTVALGLLICLLITMILYVDFTPYGLSEVKGVQARYLLPLFYPFLAVIGSASIRNEMSRTAYNSMCLGSAVFILLFGIWETAISSYSWMV